ncbi:DUF29 domain-containing protein [Azospirillum sp. SYSU D00513]|uniref:DUF29 domain-containing protein n=1 Tax=Azospirillum sp. SYSU D00513 TaxID=2812561 RepID=UPI001A9627E0|nr:DUF29 domain-containing protein [Azospirillum sp. SYSU D00513]
MGFDAKYDRDFYAWTREQAVRLREAAATGTNLPLDWENLAEEIESLGRSDYRGLASQMSRLIEHLLNLEHSPASNPRGGWARTVRDARGQIELITADSPSLKARYAEALDWAWRQGRNKAMDGLEQDGLGESALPAQCPYSLEQLFDDDFQPVNRHGLD